ncbi:MAG TPA: response regulator [Rhizomicrobium sp.]|nr:response regulator [Rhizomicrobium sp.]
MPNNQSAIERPVVLVVEDEPLVRMLAVEVLKDAGYQVLEASDGIEALQALDRARVDLLITDIQMPRLNGYQLVEAAMAKWPDLKSILVTGYAREDVPAAVADAAPHTLQKPFDIDSLPGLVARILSWPAAPGP